VTITYSLYTASSQIISEATVFQNMGFNLARFVADQTEGARVGLALANQNPTDWNVTITINAIDGTVLGSVTVTIPARQSVSKFIDELVSGAQNGRGSIVMVQIDPGTTSGISAVGFRFTSTFTTVPIS